MPPTRWVETTGAIGIITKNGAGGGLVGNSDRFDKDQSVIERHIANVFKEGELEKETNMQILHNTLSKYKPTAIYNFDVINNVFKEGELEKEGTCAKIAHTTRHGE